MTTLNLGSLVFLSPIWLILAVLLCVSAFLFRHHRWSSDWHRVMNLTVLGYLARQYGRSPPFNLSLLLAALVAVALSKPVLRYHDDETWRHSIGWLAVADVSRSMTIDDIVPSRLSAMRHSLDILSDRAGARPIALILYAGDAFMAAPPSFDRTLFDDYAALLEHGIVPQEGSSLARALSLASSVIEESQFIAARVFVLSDTGGINNTSLAAARHLQQNGHRVDVLVYGTENSDSSLNGMGPEVNVNRSNALALAKAGGGNSLFANRFGVLDWAELKLERQEFASSHAELEALVWQNQAHWMLLFALPLFLYLYRQVVLER